MGILVVIALETNTITEIVLAMESDIIAINANANTANLGSITTIVLCSVIIIAIIIIAIEIAFIEMSISCRGCWGIRSAQWQGELDGPDVTGRDVSWEMTEKRVRHGMVFPIGPVSKEFLFPGRWRKIRFVKGRRQTSSHDDYVAGIDVPWKDSRCTGVGRRALVNSVCSPGNRRHNSRCAKAKLHTRWSAISPNRCLCINRTEAPAQNQLFCLARGT